jgi:hypothetical protein
MRLYTSTNQLDCLPFGSQSIPWLPTVSLCGRVRVQKKGILSFIHVDDSQLQRPLIRLIQLLLFYYRAIQSFLKLKAPFVMICLWEYSI